MVAPIVCSIMREVFSQAPTGEREAALALGATKWGMIRSVVLPYGRGGMIGGTMLGLGRALGRDDRGLPDHFAGLLHPATHPAERHQLRLRAHRAALWGSVAVRYVGADGRRFGALPDDPGGQLRGVIDRGA